MYLPIDGMEESDEIVESGSESGAKLGGDLFEHVCHQVHVIVQGRFQIFHLRGISFGRGEKTRFNHTGIAEKRWIPLFVYAFGSFV